MFNQLSKHCCFVIPRASKTSKLSQMATVIVSLASTTRKKKIKKDERDFRFVFLQTCLRGYMYTFLYLLALIYTLTSLGWLFFVG